MTSSDLSETNKEQQGDLHQLTIELPKIPQINVIRDALTLFRLLFIGRAIDFTNEIN